MREKLTNPDHVRTWPGTIPVEHVYTVGVAGEAFLRAIKERGRLVAVGCPGCGTDYLPPRLYCERCFEKTGEVREVEARGTVDTFTVAHRDLEGHPLEKPQVYAFVRIDGTGGGLVHRLGEVDPDDVHIGMEVQAVFLPPAQRTGSILDIVNFKPAE
ncbi:MAG: Zn-ribbon domain-containing OB-fold protein [bacterium]|jgi:hypothetical protein|nr:Zn-ribbon domain-containing OB-fold protein [bacterium]